MKLEDSLTNEINLLTSTCSSVVISIKIIRQHSKEYLICCNVVFKDKQGRKRPLDTPKRMIWERLKERPKERYRIMHKKSWSQEIIAYYRIIILLSLTITRNGIHGPERDRHRIYIIYIERERSPLPSLQPCNHKFITRNYELKIMSRKSEWIIEILAYPKMSRMQCYIAQTLKRKLFKTLMKCY